MSMNFNSPTAPPASPKRNNTKTIIGAIITAVIVLAITIMAIQFANKMNGVTEGSSVSSKIISGEYDTMVRQKCIEKLNSYGLGTVPEGSINLCVDTAKAIAYHELNK